MREEIILDEKRRTTNERFASDEIQGFHAMTKVIIIYTLDIVIEQDILSFSFVLKNVPEIEAAIKKPVRVGSCELCCTSSRYPVAIDRVSRILNSFRGVSKPSM